MPDQFVGFPQFLIKSFVIVAFHLVPADLQQVDDVLRYIRELAFLNGVQRLEVIVYMLQAWLTEASDAIYQFTGKVVALIVIESFLQHRLVIQAAHGKRACTFHLLDKLLFELYRSHVAAQSAQVLM